MALLLDGVNDHGDIGTLNNLDAAQITMAGWVKYDTAPPSGQVEIALQFADASNAGPSLAIVEASGSVYLEGRYGWSTTSGRWRGSTALEAGRWYHVAMTYDRGATSNDAALYVDGAAETVTETIAPTGTVRSGQDRGTIGMDRGSSAFLDGAVQDLGAWDSILSPREIEAAYLMGPEGVSTASRQAWWPLLVSGIDRTGASDAEPTNGATVDTSLGFPTSSALSVPVNWSALAASGGRRAIAQLAIEGLTDVICTDTPADPKTATKAVRASTTAYLASASVPNVFVYGDATFIVAYKAGAVAGGSPAVIGHRNGSTDTQGIAIGRNSVSGAFYAKVGTTTVTSSLTPAASTAWSMVGVSVGGETGLEVSFIVQQFDSDGLLTNEATEHISADGDDGPTRSAWSFSEAIEIGRVYDGSSQNARGASFGYAAIYSRALSISDMRRLFGRTIGAQWPHHADLIEQWPLEEGAGTIARGTEGRYPLTLSGSGGSWATDAPHSLEYRHVLGISSSAGQQLEPRATRTTISGASMIVLDTDEWMTRWLGEIDYAIRDRSAYLWIGWEGLHEDEYVLALAGTVAQIAPLVGRGYELTIGDAKRLAKRGQLRLGSTTSLGPLTDSDTTIKPQIAAGFAGQTYAENLGGADLVGYVQIEDEIIQYTGVTTDSQVVTEFTGATRGALGTTAADHTDGASIEEVYVDRNAHPIDMALRLLLSEVGNNRNRSGYDVLSRYGAAGGRDVTDGRGAGVSLADLDLISWIRVRRERYGYQYEGSLVVSREIDDIKEFVEREILRPLGAFLFVTVAGKLAVGTWHGDAPTATTPALERGDMLRPRVAVDLSTILNSIQVRYDRSLTDGSFGSVLAIEDADSGAKHGRSETLSTESPWIRTDDLGGTTLRPIRKVVETGKQILFSRFNGPISQVELAASLSQIDLGIGDLVTVQHPHLPDFSDGVRGLLGSAFQVVSRSVDLKRGRMLFRLIEALTTTITLTEDEDVAGFVETFTGADLGASFSTGTLDFTPKGVFLCAMQAGRFGIGFAISTSTTAGQGQGRAEFNGGALGSAYTEIMELAGTDYGVTAMSSAGITITRKTGSTASTAYMLLVFG